MNSAEENKLMRRVAGHHDIRMDGMLDLVIRARDRTVMDVGCNRGLVAYEMFQNGARIVHGCDNFKEGIETARQLFADHRNVQAQFECVDLTKGSSVLAPFGTGQWDIVLMLATYHKLKRVMSKSDLSDLMRAFGSRTTRYFGWRGTSEKASENEGEIFDLDKLFKDCGLKRIHTSYISQQLGVAAIWARL